MAPERGEGYQWVGPGGRLRQRSGSKGVCTRGRKVVGPWGEGEGDMLLEGSRLVGPSGVGTRGEGVGHGSDLQGVGSEGVGSRGGLVPGCGTIGVGRGG